MRVALDQPTASLRDQLDGSAQGNRRQALTAKAALDQDAGDPAVGPVCVVDPADKRSSLTGLQASWRRPVRKRYCPEACLGLFA